MGPFGENFRVKQGELKGKPAGVVAGVGCEVVVGEPMTYINKTLQASYLTHAGFEAQQRKTPNVNTQKVARLTGEVVATVAWQEGHPNFQ